MRPPPFSTRLLLLLQVKLCCLLLCASLDSHVQVKDGSIYSGIFHTTSVDNQYGIVLKKARMTKKGKNNANVVNGGVIETLVILSDDLVQVIAKGVPLATDLVTRNIAIGNGKAAVPCEHLGCDAKKLTKLNMDKRKINQNRQNDNGHSHTTTSEKVGKENGGRKFPIDLVKCDVEHVTTAQIDKSKTDEASGSSVDARKPPVLGAMLLSGSHQFCFLMHVFISRHLLQTLHRQQQLL